MSMISATLKYGSPDHARLKARLQEMQRNSQNKVAERTTKWIEAENLYLAYVPKSDEEKRRESKQNEGSVVYSQIAIPYSYATLLTAHMYWSSVFLGRSPVNQFTARHGESHQQVQAIEALLDYQVQVGQMLVPYYIWMLDSGKYGVGIVSTYWDREEIVTAEFVNQPKTFLGMPIPGTGEKVRQEKVEVGYIGNRLSNVRPYDWRPDPRVSLINFQSGEYCGHMAYPSWNDIVKSDRFINRDVIQKIQHHGMINRETGSSQINLPEVDMNTNFRHYDGGSDKPSTIEVFEVVVNLVPSEWNLEGGGNRLEKWVFSLAANEVIIQARPLGCKHNKFPYAILPYEVDGYSHQSRGMMEILKPLNETLNWLFNSHFFNVRKVLNDVLIYDPSRIVQTDLTEGGPGKLVRLAPTAFGQDPGTVIKQLPVTDVTRSHLADASLVMQLMQRVSGVTDNLMGLLDPGGRKTATEVRTSSSFGINRLKTVAEYMSAVGFAPLAQIMVQNTQQYYDLERQFKIAGDLMTADPRYRPVKPDDIAGFYDFVPVDGTMPVDRFAQANLWKEILMGMSQMPQIAMTYDLGGIFQWMAQLAGLKNITQFKLQANPMQVMSDGDLMNQVEKGDMVPINGSNGAGIRVTGNQATSSAGVGAVPKY